jgi:EmrB/QacA subfamily drug resistance transporter
METKTIPVQLKPHSADQVLPFRESLLAVLGIAFVVMLVSLDQAIVSTALPAIVADLNGFELYAWVANAYLLTSIVTVPICGRLGDYYGRKPFILAAIIIFTGASVLCALAHSMLVLVVARALQGAGGGMMIGTAMASVPDLFPNPRSRLRWQMIISSGIGIANASGPSLGGILTEEFGWRSLFYVNLPIGLVSLAIVWRYLPHIISRKSQTPLRIDWTGAALVALGLGTLQISSELLLHSGWSAGAVVLLVLSTLALAALWWWEGRVGQPIVPLEMFRNPGLGPLFVLAVLGGFMMFSLLIYVPLLFQGGMAMGPRDAGLLITPLVIGIPIGSLINSRIVTRLRSPRKMLRLGFVLLTMAALCVCFADLATARYQLLLSMSLGGLGLGLINPNLVIFSQVMAGRQALGIATAMQHSLRMAGGMVGTALVGSVVRFHYAASVDPVFADPQILVDRPLRDAVLARLQAGGHDAGALLLHAREALSASIHLGVLFTVAVGAVAIWRVSRVPHIPFTPHA